MGRKIISLLLILNSFLLTSQLKSPESFFGYEPGTYFNLHHQLLDYFSILRKILSFLKSFLMGKVMKVENYNLFLFQIVKI